MATRQLQVVLDLDTGSYSRGMNSAGAEMKSFGKTVQEADKTVGGLGGSLDQTGKITTSGIAKLRDYALTIAGVEAIVSSFGHTIAGVIEESISMSSELERQMLLMKGMSTALTDAAKTQEATDNMAQLFDMATKTGYSVQDLANTFVRLKSTGIDPWKGDMRDVTDAVAAFGGNSNTLQHVSLALQEMADKGTLSLKELRRQFAIFVPDGMRTMAEVLGMTIDEMDKKIAAGAIAARPAMQLMLNQLGILHAGAADAMSQTLTGQLNALHTNMIKMAQEFTGQGSKDANSLYNTIKGVMSQINGALASNSGRAAFAGMGKDLGEIIHLLAEVSTKLIEYRSVVLFLGEAMATVFAIRIVRAWGGDFLTLLASMRKSTEEWIAGERSSVASATELRIQNNAALVAGVRANQELLVSVEERARVEAAAAQAEEDMARVQRANAAAALEASQVQVTALRNQQLARLRLVETMEQEQAAALQQLQTGRTVTGQFVANARATAEYEAATSRLNTAQSMLTRTDAQLAEAEAVLIEKNGELTGAEGVLSTAASNASAAFVRQTEAAEASAAGITLMERAAAAGAVAVEGLGAAIKFALGPWGIMITLAYEAASAMGLFESAADQAAAAADRMANGFAKAGDQALVAAQKSRDAQNIMNLQNGVGGVAIHQGKSWLDTGLSFYGTGRLSNAIFGSRDQKVKDLQGDISHLNDGIAGAVKTGREALQNRIISEAQGNIDSFRNRAKFIEQQQREAIISSYGKAPSPTQAKEMQQRLQAVDFQTNDAINSHAQDVVTNLTKIGAKYRDNSVGAHIYQQAVGQLSGQIQTESSAMLLNNALNGETAKGHDKAGAAAKKAADQVARLGVRAAEAQAKAQGLGGELAKVNAEIDKGLHKGWSDAQIAQARGYARAIDAAHAAMKAIATDDAFDKRIASTAGRIAELQSKLADGGLTKETDKFDAEKGAHLFDGVSADRLAAYRQQLVEVDKLTNDISVKDVGDSLDKAFVKADEDAKAMWDSYQNGTVGADKKTDQLRASLMAAFSGKNIDPTKMQEFLAMVDKIVDRTKAAQALSTADTWVKEAAKINNSLLDERQQRIADFQDEDRRRRQELETFKEGTKERQEAESAFFSWHAAAERKLARDNESAVVKQMRDWYKLGDAMQQALGGALSSFTDELANGSFQFGKFAEEIIRNLFKIILQATIAYGILSMIGGTSAPNMSFSSFLKQGISQGVSMQAPIHHTGGVIGQGTAFKPIDPAAFIDASKYHGGGVIGKLGPKEVPMIGLEGEQVLTEDQQKNISAALRSPPKVTVNVINNGAENVEPTVDTHFNGEEMIVSVVLDRLQKQGRLRDAVSTIARS